MERCVFRGVFVLVVVVLIFINQQSCAPLAFSEATAVFSDQRAPLCNRGSYGL
jgi:hypothetical protein